MYRYFFVLFVLAMLVPWAQSADIGNDLAEAHFVTRQEVRAALLDSLSGTGLAALKFAESDVVLPAVPTKGLTPELQVVSVTANARKGLIEARLRCLHQECLPFCATVYSATLPKPLDALPPGISVNPRTVHGGPVGTSLSPLVRAGETARLFVITPGIRISVPVVCLQQGEAGQFIRLRALATGKMLVGRVESKGVLSSRGVER